MSVEEIFDNIDKTINGYHDWLKSRIKEYKDSTSSPLLLQLLSAAVLDIEHVQYANSIRDKALYFLNTKIELRLSRLEQLGHDIKDLQESQKELEKFKESVIDQVKVRAEKIAKNQEDMKKILPGVM